MQPTLPVKWKIFRIANYLHMAGVASIGLLIIYLVTTFGLKTAEDFFFMFLFTTGVAVLLANSIISLYLLDRCYPDKQPGRSIPVISTIILILCIIIILLLIIPFYYGFYATFFERRRPDLLGVLMLLVVFATIITGIYICWFQVVLKRVLKKNFKLAMENFLNTDV